MEIACFKHISALRDSISESNKVWKQDLYYIFFPANIRVLLRSTSSSAIFHYSRDFCPGRDRNRLLPIHLQRDAAPAERHGVEDGVSRQDFGGKIGRRRARRADRKFLQRRTGPHYHPLRRASAGTREIKPPPRSIAAQRNDRILTGRPEKGKRPALIPAVDPIPCFQWPVGPVR